MNLSEPIRRLARVAPDAVAIRRADDSAISYAVLDHAIDRMAVYAQRLGLCAGDTVGLPITGPDESIGLTLALALARIGVASAAPTVPRDHLRLRFDPGPNIEPGHVAFGPSWMASDPAPPDHNPVPIHRDDSAIFRIYASSGTTGSAKHVPVSHRVMAARIHGRWIAEGTWPSIRMIGISIGSNWGMESALRTLWVGGTIVLSNPAAAARAIARHGVTSICTSPFALRQLLDALPQGAGPFPSLEKIEVGGSTLPDALHRLATVRLTPHIVTTYGAAECGGIASARRDRLAARPGATGYIWPGVDIVAHDAAGTPLPPGQEGSLRMRGERIADAYLDPDIAGDERFHDGWFHSNDIGTVWPDGMLTLSGRANEVINAGGVKIHPEVIETALAAMPGIRDAAAFGVPDETGITRIWAAIVADTPIDDAALTAYCLRHLADIPMETIIQVAALPRNENGKPVRARLVEAALQMQRNG